jgi:hypothetical protein
MDVYKEKLLSVSSVPSPNVTHDNHLLAVFLVPLVLLNCLLAQTSLYILCI